MAVDAADPPAPATFRPAARPLRRIALGRLPEGEFGLLGPEVLPVPTILLVPTILAVLFVLAVGGGSWATERNGLTVSAGAHGRAGRYVRAVRVVAPLRGLVALEPLTVTTGLRHGTEPVVTWHTVVCPFRTGSRWRMAWVVRHRPFAGDATTRITRSAVARRVGRRPPSDPVICAYPHDGGNPAAGPRRR